MPQRPPLSALQAPDREADARAQQAAETVRQHLVRLRGGAPFLSASDGAQLVAWLDEGVPLHRILRGIEVAANQRIARRVRAPLRLTHARRHLGRPARTRLSSSPEVDPASPLAASSQGPALQPILQALRVSPLAAKHPDLIEACCQDLATIDPPHPDAPTQAIERLARLWDACWSALDDEGRRPYLHHAQEQLGDLLEDAKEGDRERLLETWGRAALRAEAPGCGASDVLHLLEAP